MKYYRHLIYTFFITAICVFITSCGSIGSSTVNLASLPDHYEQVALLLPLHGSYGGPGRAIRDGFLAGYYSSGKGNMNIKVYDTSTNADIRTLYAQAITNGAQMVVGPLTKPNVAALANADIKVPTIALNYVTEVNPASLFFEFGISPQNEATQVATKAAGAGLHNALIIAPQENWGQTIANAFTQQWKQSGGSVAGQLYYSPTMDMRTAIRNLLRANPQAGNNAKITGVQRRTDFDSIFLVATPDSARQIVPLLNFYYAGNVPTYSISMIYSGTENINFNRDMDGVIFDDVPWIFKASTASNVQQTISNLWPATYRSYARLYALGLDAFSLTQNLKQLPNNPDAGIQGNTGKLYLGSNHWIMQKFVWAQFRNGQAVRIN